ncbi:MAG: hypothetical protein EA394_02645 [Bacteroidia bacterium]|nr:MAG: hypothetical protein EA394_02645 [Bacteroidia bacterium]
MVTNKIHAVLSMLIVIVTFTSCLTEAKSQEGHYVVPDYKGSAESFFSLKDTIIRQEVGSFTFIGSLLGLTGKASLREFELYGFSHQTLTLVLGEKSVFISRAPFHPSLHRISYFGPHNYVYLIDGRYFWGFDGRLPSQRLLSVHVSDGVERMSLPHRAIRDIFEPNFCKRRLLFGRIECQARAFLSEDGKRIYIYMVNSRVPSLYEVTWIIRKGEYLGRVVDYAY